MYHTSMSRKSKHSSSFSIVLTITILTSLAAGFAGGLVGAKVFSFSSVDSNVGFFQHLLNSGLPQNSTKSPGVEIITPRGEKIRVVKQEDQVVDVVKQASPAVVSIIITKNLSIIERDPTSLFEEFFGEDFFNEFFGPFGSPQSQPRSNQRKTLRRQVGGGTGFIISPDGLILTNKHVVGESDADYTVIMTNGQKYPAKVLSRHPILDLAVIKIEGKDLPTLELGSSSELMPGQTVIAIGNALGEFSNTVSVGVISGLGRSIVAQSSNGAEQLSKVIQTDAAINRGNSGGPLLNLAGRVIGINTAIVAGAQNIGFAIPINDAKDFIDDVEKFGRSVIPFLGVRYLIINPEIAKENNLPFDYGALIVQGEDPTSLAVVPGSPADKIGLKENDIILELNGQRISQENPLIDLIMKQEVGQEITLKVYSNGETRELKTTLVERQQ